MIDKELHRGDIIVNESNDKRCYAVIVTNDSMNFSEAYVSCVNITAGDVEGGPMYVPITVNCPGHAVCGRVWNVWRSNIVEFIRECTAEEMRAIDKALRYSFGLVEVGVSAVPSQEAERLQAENKDLTCKVHEQMEQIRNLNRELEDARKDTEFFMQKAVAEKDTAADAAVLTAERDTYKAMYDSLIDRMFRK